MSNPQETTKTTALDSMEDIVGRLLQIGTTAASVLVGVGLVVLFLGIAPALAPKLITAGLIILVSTPVLRVVAALGVFVREKDWIFAAISTTVLVVLGVGVLLGKTH